MLEMESRPGVQGLKCIEKQNYLTALCLHPHIPSKKIFVTSSFGASPRLRPAAETASTKRM